MHKGPARSTVIHSEQTVATIVLDHSECASVFQRHRIDFCCRGDLSLERAAKERRVDLPALLAELEEAIAARRDGGPNAWKELPTPALVDHIVAKHHDYLRKALPFLRPLAAKVARVHGDHNPRLRDLDEAVGRLSESLLAHIEEEEKVLFPALTSSASRTAELEALLRAMRDDHLDVAKLLEDIRRASEDFAVPEWACGSYRVLFGELEELEADVFRHVHLENHVLAPRFAPTSHDPPRHDGAA